MDSAEQWNQLSHLSSHINNRLQQTVTLLHACKTRIRLIQWQHSTLSRGPHSYYWRNKRVEPYSPFPPLLNDWRPPGTILTQISLQQYLDCYGNGFSPRHDGVSQLLLGNRMLLYSRSHKEEMIPRRHTMKLHQQSKARSLGNECLRKEQPATVKKKNLLPAGCWY